jgi:hypothetical protein
MRDSPVGARSLAAVFIELSRALMAAEELKGWCQMPHHRLVGLTPGQVADEDTKRNSRHCGCCYSRCSAGIEGETAPVPSDRD